MESVKEQYERFPYPPIGRFALPKRAEGQSLRYETAARDSHRGKRILVAGGGTLEPLVVAQMHPHAKEIVAVDLSDSSLKQLKNRVRFSRILRFPRRLPPLKYIQADLHQWLPEYFSSFDYVIASNVIHHVAEPAALMKLLSSSLRENGILRLVTYPHSSRLWMRETGRWLRVNGISPKTPDLLKEAQSLIRALPVEHAVRSNFESQPETGTEAGLVDAFLHACENSLSPLEWAQASADSHLQLIAETQTDTSRSNFLSEILPETAKLDSWIKLQILDDLLELCANPVLWFRKEKQVEFAKPVIAEKPVSPKPIGRDLILTKRTSPETVAEAIRADQRGVQFLLPSRVLFEMSVGLKRAESLLESAGAGLKEALETLQREVGPRVTAPQGFRKKQKPLPGLSILDHPLREVLELSEPWDSEEWDALEKILGPGWEVTRLRQKDRLESRSLSQTVEWIQARYGSLEPKIALIFRKKS